MDYKNVKVEEELFWKLKQIEIDQKFKKLSDVIEMLYKYYGGKQKS